MTVKAGSEAAWQIVVENLAGFGGWSLTYHTHDSRRSQKGWPDDVFCREETDLYVAELIVAELKAESTRVTPEQLRWLAALRSAGVEAYLWRPSDKAEVEARLLRPRILRTEGQGPGICAVCESPHVYPLLGELFKCATCAATWTGRRERQAA